MNVILTGDHAGKQIRDEIKHLLEEMDIAYTDAGASGEASVDYPDYAVAAARRVAGGEFDRGIFICGTGIGMSISANKIRGVRAALTQDVYSAKLSRRHNDANVLTMGERVIGPGPAREVAKAWLETTFDGGRHERRVEKISEYEDA